MPKGKIIIISGPSGSGKTTIYNRLLKSPQFKNKLIKTVSVTTRGRRAGEREGIDYYFVSLKMFQYKIKAGHFLEHEKVHGHYYGTPKKTVTDILALGKNVLLCIDVKGADNVCQNYPRTVRIFIKTKTFGELKKRLQNRNTDNKQTIDLRLETAKQEMQRAKDYNHVVINDDLEKTVKKVSQIIAAEIFL